MPLCVIIQCHVDQIDGVDDFAVKQKENLICHYGLAVGIMFSRFDYRKKTDSGGIVAMLGIGTEVQLEKRG